MLPDNLLCLPASSANRLPVSYTQSHVFYPYPEERVNNQTKFEINEYIHFNSYISAIKALIKFKRHRAIKDRLIHGIHTIIPLQNRISQYYITLLFSVYYVTTLLYNTTLLLFDSRKCFIHINIHRNCHSGKLYQHA